MLLNKNLAVFLALSAFSGVSLANEVEVSTLLSDNFHGAGNSNEHAGGPVYNILALEAERVTNNSNQTFLNVYIDTNFTAQTSDDRGNIDYGDLFITTTDLYTPDTNATTFSSNPSNPGYNRRQDLGSDSRWQYAFDIENSDEDTGGSGDLVKLYSGQPSDIGNNNWKERAYANSLQTAKEFNSQRDGRDSQAVKVRESTGNTYTGNGGNYIETANNSASNYWSNDIGGGENTASNRVTFSFEITGIDALINTDQLAFRWAMTCANDIIEGLVSFRPPASVPEPATWALMLLAIVGLKYGRKRAYNSFSS